MGSSSGNSSPCASCKLLRRRCAKDCIFAPYFPSDDPHKFAIVHKVFGASNVSKMLQELAVDQRADAVSSLVYEATARTRDPVYGCVGAISYLQTQVSQLQMQLAMAQAEILYIQMQHEQTSLSVDTAIAAIATDDHSQIESSFYLQNNYFSHHQYPNFASTSSSSTSTSSSNNDYNNNVVIQDYSLKRESFFGHRPHDMVSEIN